MNHIDNPDTIRSSARKVSPRKFNRNYPEDFVSDDDYRATLPDLQNESSSSGAGARVAIQHVGIAGFRLPIRYRVRGGGEVVLETSVSGSVDLDATKRGINMSRILRSFYVHSEKSFAFDAMNEVLKDYIHDLESNDARLLVKLSYPVKRQSLRSGLEGYQYYDVALELTKTGPVIAQIIHLDYVYSSTCPCSLELSEHARDARNQLATPHSQRSVARVSIKLASGIERYWFEDLIDICRKAIPTETQVMVKREDEQAFAELNAANPIFVEDAVRRLCAGLQADKSIEEFRIVASHQESLHSHDAISVLTQGPTFQQYSIDPALFGTLVHRTN
jgi:GTP cyclohydrolase I